MPRRSARRRRLRTFRTFYTCETRFRMHLSASSSAAGLDQQKQFTKRSSTVRSNPTTPNAVRSLPLRKKKASVVKNFGKSALSLPSLGSSVRLWNMRLMCISGIIARASGISIARSGRACFKTQQKSICGILERLAQAKAVSQVPVIMRKQFTLKCATSGGMANTLPKTCKCWSFAPERRASTSSSTLALFPCLNGHRLRFLSLFCLQACILAPRPEHPCCISLRCLTCCVQTNGALSLSTYCPRVFRLKFM
eukprot:4980630-Pleurochrysis_carterae.AAC.1